MQIAFSFDKETLRKIIKGFIHSLIVATLLVVLDFFAKLAGLVHFSDPFISSAYAMVSANIYNIAKEYISGI